MSAGFARLTGRVDEVEAVGRSWAPVDHEEPRRRGGPDLEGRAPSLGRGTAWSWSADVVMHVATADEAAKCNLALRSSCSHNLDHRSVGLCTVEVSTWRLFWKVVTGAVDYHSESQACLGSERHVQWSVAAVGADWRWAVSEKCLTRYCWCAMSTQSHWRYLGCSCERGAASAWSKGVVRRRVFVFHRYHR